MSANTRRVRAASPGRTTEIERTLSVGSLSTERSRCRVLRSLILVSALPLIIGPIGYVQVKGLVVAYSFNEGSRTT